VHKQSGEKRGSAKDKPAGRKLTPKQERFAALYVSNGGNATEAYRSAYACARMSPAAITEEASRLRRRPDIALRIDELRACACAKAGIDISAWVRRVAELSFGDIGEVCDWAGTTLTVRDASQLTKEQRAMIGSIKRVPGQFGERIEVHLREPARYLEMLGKYLGALKEQEAVGGVLDSATERMVQQASRLSKEELRAMLEAELEKERLDGSA